MIQDISVPTPNSERERVDLTKEEGEDDGESMDFTDSGSSPIYTSGGEEDKANTRVPSAPQMEATRSQMGTSDTSPRTESGDNDELSQAEPN